MVAHSAVQLQLFRSVYTNSPEFRSLTAYMKFHKDRWLAYVSYWQQRGWQVERYPDGRVHFKSLRQHVSRYTKYIHLVIDHYVPEHLKLENEPKII